jgi:hypothetical protein
MKAMSALTVLACLVIASACTPAEKIRVENVIGPYDCAYQCTHVDLTGQVADSIVDGNETIFVTKAENWDEGYIDLRGHTVFLLEDSTFTLSEADYFLSGEFAPDGRIIFTETTIQRADNMRLDCNYLGYLK